MNKNSGLESKLWFKSIWVLKTKLIFGKIMNYVCTTIMSLIISNEFIKKNRQKTTKTSATIMQI